MHGRQGGKPNSPTDRGSGDRQGGRTCVMQAGSFLLFTMHPGTYFLRSLASNRVPTCLLPAAG